MVFKIADNFLRQYLISDNIYRKYPKDQVWKEIQRLTDMIIK